MRHIPVVVEELQAGLTVHFGEIVTQAVAAREEVVELAVAEAYDRIVVDGASVIHPTDIGPQAGTEAHVARLAGGVDVAACQVVCP